MNAREASLIAWGVEWADRMDAEPRPLRPELLEATTNLARHIRAKGYESAIATADRLDGIVTKEEAS